MATNSKTLTAKWLIKRYNRSFGIDIRRHVAAGTNTIELKRDPETDIQQFHPPIVGDGQFYTELSQFDWYYQKNKSEFNTAARLTKGASVCEIGCGAGDFAAHSGASEYVGLELNARSVELGQTNGVEVQLEEVTEHLERVGSERYDVVCAFQVLEHVPDPEGFVATASALVKPGGWVMFSVPADDSFIGLVPNNILNMPPHHQTRWSDRALDLLGPRHGLNTIAIVHEDLDEIHYNWAQNALLGATVGGGAPGARYRIPSRTCVAAGTWPSSGAFLEGTHSNGHLPEIVEHEFLEVGR